MPQETNNQEEKRPKDWNNELPDWFHVMLERYVQDYEQIAAEEMIDDVFYWLDTLVASETAKAVEGERERLRSKIEKGIETTEPAPCPDGKFGCLVYHTRIVRRDLTTKELLSLLHPHVEGEK